MVRVEDVRRFRFRRHQLDREPPRDGSGVDADLLDYGVQDTGPDGAGWALAIRGAAGGELVYAWTIRGAPHAYRRQDVGAVAVATAPLSETDAGKRVFDAVRPLRAAGIPVLDALKVIAGHMREVVRKPIVKGELSSRLTQLVDDPYLRTCRPCKAVHLYENPFRLAALQAGLELEPGTSPPVLRRIPGLRAPMYRRLGGDADAPFHAVRNYVRFYGPARPRDAAEFLDSPLKEVEEHWPTDVAEVTVGGDKGSRFVLAEDRDTLAAGDDGSARPMRLLGPYDPYLQLRDREVLVADAARRKELWPVLGRPGAIVSGGDVLGVWRPRSSGSKLRLAVEPWTRFTAKDRAGVEEQAERLAAHRGVTLAGVLIGSE